MAAATQPIEIHAQEPPDGDNYALLPAPKRPQTQPNRVDDFPELYSDIDVIDYARKGPSLIAARKKFYPNEDIDRGFGYLDKRILLDLAQRLGCLELELLRLDREEDEEALRQYAFDRDAFLALCKGLPDPAAENSNHTPTQDDLNKRGRMKERESLLYNIRVLKKEYNDILIDNKEIQAMAQVSPKQHYAVYRRIVRNGILAPSASQYLWNRDDFITSSPDLLHQRFEWLLYTTEPFACKISRFFRQYFRSFCRCFNLPTPSAAPSRTGREDGRREYDYDAVKLKWISRFTLAPTVAIFLLVPVAILFFGNLSKPAEFGVVLAFVALFVFTLSCFERSTVKVIIGVCAFIAVLAAFLAK